jgi:hypothetical protein
MKLLWHIGVFALMATTVTQPSLGAKVFGQSGTLIMLIPSAEGLVVAADTRHTTNGVSCDFDTKLFTPKNLKSTIFGFSGTATFLAVKQPFGPDPCADVRDGYPLLKIEPIVREFLEKEDTPVSKINLTKLGHLCMDAVVKLFTNMPIDRRIYVERKNILTVVLGSYDGATQTSFIRSISIDMPTESQIAVNLATDNAYILTGTPDWRAFGQGGYLVEHVINGVGKQFIDPNYEDFTKITTIGNVSATLAAAVAENLIDATSKTTNLISIPSGVGGKIDIFLLDKNEAKRLK